LLLRAVRERGEPDKDVFEQDLITLSPRVFPLELQYIIIYVIRLLINCSIQSVESIRVCLRLLRSSAHSTRSHASSGRQFLSLEGSRIGADARRWGATGPAHAFGGTYFEYRHDIYYSDPARLREGHTVKISVKLYASFREIVGAKEEALEREEGTTVQMLLDDYIRRFPQMARYREHIILSVNKEYGAPTRVLRDGDEVSFLPPVSGG